jgi:RimJ/RimL family protein N-acetyltransferase
MTALRYPELHSERLRLISPAEESFDAAARLAGEDAPLFIDAAQEPHAVWWSLATLIGHWQLRGYGMFVLLDRKTDAVMGMAGPWFPAGWPEPEVSYHLTEEARGRGLASEAVQCILDWLFFDQKWQSVASLIEEDNESSIKLAQRLGAKPEHLIEHQMLGKIRIWRHTPDGVLADKGPVQ